MKKVIYSINDLAFSLLLEQEDDWYHVTYGEESHQYLDYTIAATRFGLCLLHNLKCAGKMD